MSPSKLLSFAVVFAVSAWFAMPSFAAEKIDAKKLLEDRPIGKADAPVTIIEYASLTCPHCAHFNKTALPEVEKQLVDTGKAKMVFRDFPLDKLALKASQMARCAPDDKYMPLLAVIFSNQEHWARSEDPEKALAQLGALAGLDETYAHQCMDNKDLEAGVLAGMQAAQKDMNIHETPSFRFMIGGKLEEKWDEFDKVIQGLGKEKPAEEKPEEKKE